MTKNELREKTLAELSAIAKKSKLTIKSKLKADVIDELYKALKAKDKLKLKLKSTIKPAAKPIAKPKTATKKAVPPKPSKPVAKPKVKPATKAAVKKPVVVKKPVAAKKTAVKAVKKALPTKKTEVKKTIEVKKVKEKKLAAKDVSAKTHLTKLIKTIEKIKPINPVKKFILPKPAMKAETVTAIKPIKPLLKLKKVAPKIEAIKKLSKKVQVKLKVEEKKIIKTPVEPIKEKARPTVEQKPIPKKPEVVEPVRFEPFALNGNGKAKLPGGMKVVEPTSELQRTPPEFGGNTISAIPVDAGRIYAYWELDTESIKEKKGSAAIRIYDDSSYYEIDVARMGAVWLDVRPSGSYVIEAGVKGDEGFVAIVSTATVKSPEGLASEGYFAS